MSENLGLLRYKQKLTIIHMSPPHDKNSKKKENNDTVEILNITPNTNKKMAKILENLGRRYVLQAGSKKIGELSLISSF